MQRTPRCACGSASVTVTGEPEQYNVCHCTNRKRQFMHFTIRVGTTIRNVTSARYVARLCFCTYPPGRSQLELPVAALQTRNLVSPPHQQRIHRSFLG